MNYEVRKEYSLLCKEVILAIYEFIEMAGAEMLDKRTLEKLRNKLTTKHRVGQSLPWSYRDGGYWAFWDGAEFYHKKASAYFIRNCQYHSHAQSLWLPWSVYFLSDPAWYAKKLFFQSASHAKSGS